MNQEEISEFIKRLNETKTNLQYCFYAGISYDTLKRLKQGVKLKPRTHAHISKTAKAYLKKLDTL